MGILRFFQVMRDYHLPPGPAPNGPGDYTIARACLRHSSVIKKDYPVDELRNEVYQKSGIWLDDDEATRLVQQVYNEMDIGSIPEWSLPGYSEE